MASEWGGEMASISIFLWALENAKGFSKVNKPIESDDAFPLVILFPLLGDRKLEKCANGKEIPVYMYIYVLRQSTFFEQIFRNITFLTDFQLILFSVFVYIFGFCFVVVLYLVSIEQARFFLDIITVACQL